jgi:hypothetical protein
MLTASAHPIEERLDVSGFTSWTIRVGSDGGAEPLLEIRHDSSAVIMLSGIEARSLAMALAVWLFTVPVEQPMAVAISASVLSS